jgi:ribA/ribD-fused uncharacterized protein
MEEPIPDKELKLDDLQKFIKLSVKEGYFVELDPEGNWTYINDNGDVVKTLKVPKYRRATKDEIAEMEKQRIDNIKDAEKEYEKSINELLVGYEKYRLGEEHADNIVALNMKVDQESANLYESKYKEYYTYKSEPIDVFRLMYDRPYDKHKMPHSVYRSIRFPFHLQDYMRTGFKHELDEDSDVDENENEDESFNMSVKGGVILFRYSKDDPEYGYLHPDYGIDIEYENTLYYSIEQILSAEKARIYGNDKLRKQVLGTRSTSEIVKLRNTLVGGPQEEIWNKKYPDILNKATLLKFQQNEDIRNKLLSTGMAPIGNGSRDKLNGTGVAYDKPAAADKSQWVGQNLYGKAVMNARSKLKIGSGGGDEQIKGSEKIKEAAISEEAYNNKVNNARRWAIINNKRKMGAGMGARIGN